MQSKTCKVYIICKAERAKLFCAGIDFSSSFQRAGMATHTRPSLPPHSSLLPSLVKLQARTEPLQVMLPMLLRVAGLSRVTTP